MPKCYFGCAHVGSLHKFPSNNHPHTERFKQWKATLLPETQEKGDNYIFHSIRYCSRHFEDFYVNKQSRFLGRNAVPTLNLGLDNDITLHTFPRPNLEPERFRTWLYAIGGDILALDNAIIHKSRRICHRHFQTIYHTASRRLTANAVPTLHLPEFCTKPSKSAEPSTSAEPSNTEVLEDNKKQEKIINGKSTWPPVKQEITFSWQQSTEEVLDIDADTKSFSKTPTYRIDTHKPDGAVAVDSMSEKKTATLDTTRVKSTEGTYFYIINNPPKLSASLSPQDDSLHTDTNGNDGYVCNECGREILGVHYACLQCVDCDLCGACELTLVHRTHYVLRVPAYQPVNEVQATLSAIRRLLMDAVINVTIKEEKPDIVEEPIGVENPKPHFGVDLDNLDPLEPEIQELDPIATEVTTKMPPIHPNVPKTYTKVPKPATIIPKSFFNSSVLDPNAPKVVTRRLNLHPKRYVFDQKALKVVTKVTELNPKESILDPNAAKLVQRIPELNPKVPEFLTEFKKRKLKESDREKDKTKVTDLHPKESFLDPNTAKLVHRVSELDPKVPEFLTEFKKRKLKESDQKEHMTRVTELHPKESVLDTNAAKLVQRVPELQPKVSEFLTEYKKRKLKESDQKEQITRVTELHPKESVLDTNAAKLVQRVPELQPKVSEFLTEYKKRKLKESERKEHRVKIELTTKKGSDGPSLDTNKPWRVSHELAAPAPRSADCKQATVLLERLSKAELEAAALRP